MLLSIASGSPVTSLKKLETSGAENVGAGLRLATAAGFDSGPATAPQPAATNAVAKRRDAM